MMLRIGLVGINWIHTFVYPAFFNGINETYQQKTNAWSQQMIALADPSGDPDMKITGAWTGGDDQGMFDVWPVPRFESLEALAENVDAVIMLEKEGQRHLELARPFLTHGLPVFIDKPFAASLADAEEMLRLAETNNTAVFSASALGFTKEVAEYRQDPGATAPRVITALGIGEYWEYAPHPIALGLDVMGEKVVNVERKQVGNTHIWHVTGANGSLLNIQLLKKGPFPGYRAYISGDDGFKEIAANDLPPAFAAIVDSIKQTFVTRKSPDDGQAMLDLVRCLEA